MVDNIRMTKAQWIGSFAHTPVESQTKRILLWHSSSIVTVVLGALFSSHALGANFTREDKILRDTATYYADLAVYGTATQSSNYSHTCKPTASKATDRNTEGVFHPWCSVTHTNHEAKAWWELDLKANSVVYVVMIFNRVDCCMNRLSNFDVILKDESQQVLNSIYEAEGGKEMMPFPVRPALTVVRYVRVQLRGKNYLSLAEVKVYGKNQFATKRDLAVNRPTTQSSTYSHECSPTASKAVDGNTEGVFYPWCSVTHTNNDQQAWWQVDLLDSRTVHSVRVFNRVDCCMERLANFNVTLKSSAGAMLTTRNFAGGTNTEIYAFERIVHGVRYVRVHLLGKNVLSLAEVQVMGE